jgi:hypothetical protein
MADGNDDLLDKADALMRRHRVFVAGANDPAFADAAETVESADEDVPVLTDVVGPELVAAVPAMQAVDLDALRAALAAVLDSWVDTELPLHVQRVLDGVTDQLILQLSEKSHGELLPRLHALVEGAGQGAKPAPADD